MALFLCQNRFHKYILFFISILSMVNVVVIKHGKKDISQKKKTINLLHRQTYLMNKIDCFKPLFLKKCLFCFCLLFLLIDISYSQKPSTNQRKPASPAGTCPVTLQSFSPTSATTGDTVKILAPMFTCAILSVSFAGVPAQSFWVDYSGGAFDTKICAVVGNGASGDIFVEVPFSMGSTTLHGFIYIPGVVQDSILYLCPPSADTVIKSTITGSSYQWEVSADSINYLPIGNNTNYGGVATATLQLTGISSSLAYSYYRCSVDSRKTKPVLIKFQNNLTGSASGTDWETTSAWSCNVLPDENTDVIINSGNIFLNTNITIRSLTLKPGANFTITSGYQLTVLH